MNEININSTIAQHRPEFSAIGSTLGAQYSRPEAKTCLPDYEKKIQTARENGNVDLVMNRVPRKFRIITHDVRSAEISQDLDGTVVVIINKGIEGSELRIPVNDEMTKAGIVTDEAIAKALKGEDTNVHFIDVEKLCKHINILNQNELSHLDVIIKDATDAKKRIESAIAENVKKAEQYKAERGNNPALGMLQNGNTTVEINVGS